jgi:hypothetical protein
MMSEPTTQSSSSCSVASDGLVTLLEPTSLRIVKRGQFFELPFKGPFMSGYSAVCEINAQRVRWVAEGDASSGMGALLLLLFLIGLPTSVFLFSLVYHDTFTREESMGVGFVPFFAVTGLVFAAFAIGVIWELFKARNQAIVTIDRASGQIRSESTGVSIAWAHVKPYVEQVQNINAGGGYTAEHLVFIDSSAPYSPGSEPVYIVVSANCGHASECLAKFEFIRRYMEQGLAWQIDSGNPEPIEMVLEKKSLLQEFKSNFWVGLVANHDWRKSSLIRKLVSVLFLIAANLIFFYMILLTLLYPKVIRSAKRRYPRQPDEFEPSRVLPASTIGVIEALIYVLIIVGVAGVYWHYGSNIMVEVAKGYLNMVLTGK